MTTIGQARAALTRARLARRQRKDLADLISTWPADGERRTVDQLIRAANRSRPFLLALSRLAGDGQGEVNAVTLRRALDRLVGKSLRGVSLRGGREGYALFDAKGAIVCARPLLPSQPFMAAEAGAWRRSGQDLAGWQERERRERQEAIVSGRLVDLDAFRAWRTRPGGEPPPSAA